MTKAIRNSGVTLYMSEEEASTLLTITRFICGDPDTSRRKHTEAMLENLEAIGVEYDVSDVDRDISEIIFITKPVKPSFNVGDVVEIVDSIHYIASFLQVGEIGVVEGVCENGVLVVMYKDIESHPYYFHPSSLKMLRKAKG